jgi:hypothetical protein
MEGSYGDGNELSDFIKFWEILEQLNDLVVSQDLPSWSFNLGHTQRMESLC